MAIGGVLIDLDNLAQIICVKKDTPLPRYNVLKIASEKDPGGEYQTCPPSKIDLPDHHTLSQNKTERREYCGSSGFCITFTDPLVG